MQNFCISKKISGISVCVSSLKTKKSPVWGDFSALLLLAEWAVKCNLQIIQIMPVFDTGWNPDAFALCSAHALNPVYLNIELLLREEHVQPQDISAYLQMEKNLQDIPRSYMNVRKEKLSFLQQFFYENIEEYPNLSSWIQENPWIIPYSVFCVLKEDYHGACWQDWGESAHPNPDILKNFWEKRKKDCQFYAWLQYHLYKQLFQISQTLTQMGITLKGELPLELIKESADVWNYPHLFKFDEENRTYAFRQITYHWEKHKQENFQWWQSRLNSMEKYFGLIRLDELPSSEYPLKQQNKKYLSCMTDSQNPPRHVFLNFISKYTNLRICANIANDSDSSSAEALIKLRILPLHSPFKTLEDKKKPQKWISPATYPLLSVASLSACASFSLHQWWQKTHDKLKFLESLDLAESLSSEDLSVETALAVLHSFLTKANSCIVILQIQDYLSLCEQYRDYNSCNRKTCSQTTSLDTFPLIKPLLEELLNDKRFIFLVKVVNTPL